ncbi:MAG: hypothetical protein LBT00_14035, partial [Spirochaetaceae bacterium]|nr:hypothetical protein [Spirochaetaceae bacterium]
RIRNAMYGAHSRTFADKKTKNLCNPLTTLIFHLLKLLTVEGAATCRFPFCRALSLRNCVSQGCWTNVICLAKTRDFGTGSIIEK